MNYPLIFERVYMRPLCLSRERFQAIHSFLLPRLTGKSPLEISMAVPTGPGGNPPPSTINPHNAKRRQKAGPTQDARGNIDMRYFTEAKPGVAVVPVYGALAKNLSSWEESCGGGTDINAIQEAFRQAVADPDIRAVVLDIDSPGGEVTGIPEFAAQIRAATAIKPIYSFTDAWQCSAAIYLGSQASDGGAFATPSATVGSIGTYIAWLDESIRMQMEGLKLELFAAGKHKGMGLPGREMSADDRTLLQNKVNTINAKFTSTVRAARPDVSDDTMQGQSFSGDDAVGLGLLDGTFSCWDEFIDAIDTDDI